MTDHSSDISIALEARDRHALLYALVERLRELLGAEAAWDRGATVSPWQVTAADFGDLPGRVIAAMLDAAEATGERLVDLELGGFLETDSGPRAWGTIATQEGAQGEALHVDGVTATEADTGWRLAATVRRGGADD